MDRPIYAARSAVQSAIRQFPRSSNIKYSATLISTPPLADPVKESYGRIDGKSINGETFENQSRIRGQSTDTSSSSTEGACLGTEKEGDSNFDSARGYSMPCNTEYGSPALMSTSITPDANTKADSPASGWVNGKADCQSQVEHFEARNPTHKVSARSENHSNRGEIGWADSVNLGAGLEAWKTKQCQQQTLQLVRQERLAKNSSKSRMSSKSRYFVSYKPLDQSSVPRWISQSASNGLATRAFSTSSLIYADLDCYNADDLKPPPLLSMNSNAKGLNIRQRLRLWEAANPVPIMSNPDRKEHVESRQLRNFLTRPEDGQAFNEETEKDASSTSFQPMFEKGELVDFGNQRTFLLPGDMVELRTPGGFGVELAIYVREIGVQSQFYTMSGKWIHRSSQLAKFFVPGFVEPHELDSLLTFLPDAAVPEALQDKLQSFKHALPRDVGSPLINKMLDFLKESDSTYRAAAFMLDNAHKLLAHKSTLRYATLHEIASELLPETLKKNRDYPAPALYALHRSLMQDVGFRAQRLGSHRTWGQFEISSIDEVKMINTVSDEVRKYQESLITSARGFKSISSAEFLEFIVKAQRLIDKSRTIRQYAPYGIIGPLESRGKGKADEGDNAPPDGHIENYFESMDHKYIRFVESWAGLRTFENHSPLHGIATTILRATGKYEDVEELDQSVGWIFLQEIGAIAPWENRVQFDLRLHQAGQILQSEEQWDEAWTVTPDVLVGLREDWGNLPVYCIDDVDAKEIDDGISVEEADLPNEYWIHIHTADPGSEITPRSILAQNAESLMRTIYLPERTVTMLPRHLVQQRFSLAPDRPSLTFSARLNFNGNLLDHKITPGIVRNVKYMTPGMLSSVTGEDPPFEETVITVGDGKLLAPAENTRPLLQRHEITEPDERNLKLLHTLGRARQSLTEERGALTFGSPSFSTSVAFAPKLMWSKQNQSANLRYCKDPTIQLRAEKWDVDNPSPSLITVRSLMLIAGEVAARWCCERGIPILNRVTQLNPSQPDPGEYFRRVILPLVRPVNGSRLGEGEITKGSKGDSMMTDVMNASQSTTLSKRLPTSALSEYMRILGAVLPSTTAAPHLALGVEMFTRSTSPLRRYSDLVVHWQIEAALLEEARLGKSLIGSTRDDYLPFKKDQLDQLIPRLHGREKALSVFEKAANRVWALQLLLRAWKFNQAQLPPTFELIARSVSSSKIISGEILSLGCLKAIMDIPKWIHPEDINVGDVFEVELYNLNVYTSSLVVKPLGRLRVAAEAPIV